MMVRKQGDWLAAKVGDELVMMSAEKGNYIGLSEVGARIWELIDTPQDLDAVCAHLQNEFEVAPEVCRAEGAGLPAPCISVQLRERKSRSKLIPGSMPQAWRSRAIRWRRISPR